MNPNQRSQWLLDIEFDLSQIKNRLNTLEDHFEHDGRIAAIALALHQLAQEIEALKARQVGDAG